MSAIPPSVGTTAAARLLFCVLIPATPPKEATKNWTGHLRAKMAAIREARATAGWAVKAALSADERDGVPDALDLWISVVWPRGQRRFDDDSLIPAIAPMRDALADAFGHRSDYHYRVRGVTQRHATDGEPPCTVIEGWTQ